MASTPDSRNKSGYSYSVAPSQEPQSQKSTSSDFAQRNPKEWKSGGFNQIPLVSCLAVIGVFLCVGSGLAVLKLSDGRSVNAWPSADHNIQPQVLLAITSAIANSLIRYVFYEELTVFWWSKALDGGRLASLHRVWSHGMSTRSSLLSGRHFDWLALGSILVTLVVIDGPLLQRSSFIGEALSTRPVNVTTRLTKELIPFQTGSSFGHAIEFVTSPS